MAAGTLGALWRLRRLAPLHARGVARALEITEGLIPEPWRGAPAADPPTDVYLARNFFSVLLLSVYRALGMPDAQLVYLAAVNHAVRAIVTAADNLIDGEDKPVLALRMPDGAARFRNTLALLTWGVALRRVVAMGWEDGGLPAERVEPAVEALLGRLVAIGAVEAEEEAGVDVVIEPDEVIERIHAYKGGALLGLAFEVPRAMAAARGARDGEGADEPGVAARERLETMAAGIHDIGLALQHVDDVTDLAIDVASRGHNLLQSEIVYGGSDAERSYLEAMRAGADGDAYREVCAATVGRVVARALDTAWRGFERMQQAGYPLEPGEGDALLRVLFRARGESALLGLAERFGEG